VVCAENRLEFLVVRESEGVVTVQLWKSPVSEYRGSRIKNSRNLHFWEL
jgi:hypothetical protein